MEIIHRISFNGDTKPYFLKEVNQQGIKITISPLPNHDVGLVTFEIVESDLRWETVMKMIDSYNAVDLIRTSFSSEEIEKSEWSRLVPLHEWGYPQPERKMKWVQLTYEDECPKCGAGYRQKAPFHLIKEPRLGRNHIFTLYWVYAVFCKHEVIDTLEQNNIFGYEEWEVLINPSNHPSNLVSQLNILEVSEPGLFEGDKKNVEICTKCGIIKYGHHRRGKLRYSGDALRRVDIQLTDEWFGSGGYGGYREIIVSNRLSRLILSQGWQGLSLKPIELI